VPVNQQHFSQASNYTVLGHVSLLSICASSIQRTNSGTTQRSSIELSLSLLLRMGYSEDKNQVPNKDLIKSWWWADLADTID
jgi:hypothetical protein